MPWNKISQLFNGYLLGWPQILSPRFIRGQTSGNNMTSSLVESFSEFPQKGGILNHSRPVSDG